MTEEFYKKHRPQSFDEIVGNEDTVEALQAFVKNGEIPHTILFTGPSGCGKTTLARILRNEMECLDSDFADMDNSTFRGIDTIRQIQATMKLKAHGDCRVWLLDEFHQMSKDGQHAALKMLEDTPPHVYFFLCTTNPEKLLPTIRTRCTRLKVKHLDESELKQVVERVAKLEGLKMPADVLSRIVDLAEGSSRSALVSLYKIARISRKKMLKVLTEDDESSEVRELCQALYKKKPWRVVAKILKSIEDRPEDVRLKVLGYMRAILLNKGDPHCCTVIELFETPLYAGGGKALLAKSCFDAVSE